jgi:DNA modification methylase
MLPRIQEKEVGEIEMTPEVKILQGDALARLRELHSESVHCVVTSPPYWGLRDYSRCGCVKREHPGDGSSTSVGSIGGFDPNHKTVSDASCPVCHGTGVIEGVSSNQFGLEKTPEEYVRHIVEASREIWRVLRKDGTYWLNEGDCYCGTGDKGDWKDPKNPDGRNAQKKAIDKTISGLKPKDLVGIPWRVAFALQADGWYLRAEVIWNKRNPMPESVRDRPTRSHEQIFLLTKSPVYFYDQEAIREDSPDNFDMRRRRDAGYIKYPSGGKDELKSNKGYSYGIGRNKRSVWEFATQPYSEAHFATFPEKIPEICIKAGTSERGCCQKCGAPFERIFGRGKKIITDAMRIAGCDENGEYHGDAQKDYSDNLAQNPSETKRRILESMAHRKRTLGWRPRCECYGIETISDEPKEPYESIEKFEEKHLEWEKDIDRWNEQWERLKSVYESLETAPCVVLDPFAGSGTTGAVANRIGRSSILIELNSEYIKLIEKRIAESEPESKPEIDVTKIQCPKCNGYHWGFPCSKLTVVQK